MNAMQVILAQADMNLPLLAIWGLGLGAVGLALRLAPQMLWRKLGTVVALVGVILIGIWLPPLGDALSQVLFWLMAAVAVVASGAAVTSRSPPS